MGLLIAPAAIPLFIAGVLLVLSVYFDSRLVVGSSDLRFWEEFIELNGYMFLVLSAWNHWQIVHRHMDKPG